MFKRYSLISYIIMVLLICVSCAGSSAAPDGASYHQPDKPESETTGVARKEDIVFRIEPIAEARRVITDKDDTFFTFIENLSGKEYITQGITLEMKKGDQWVNIEYGHANGAGGLVSRWKSDRYMLWINDFIAAEGQMAPRKGLAGGDYRARLKMNIFGRHSKAEEAIELEYEFSVITFEDAPEPGWDVSRLSLSPYDAAEQSARLTINIKNPVLNERNTVLEFTFTTEKFYTFGEPYIVEVLLDGKWYSIPYGTEGFFNLPLYSTALDEPVSHNPLWLYGILSAGQYRLIKNFDLHSTPASYLDWTGDYLVKEFAIAEFSVEETLDSLLLQ